MLCHFAQGSDRSWSGQLSNTYMLRSKACEVASSEVAHHSLQPALVCIADRKETDSGMCRWAVWERQVSVPPKTLCCCLRNPVRNDRATTGISVVHQFGPAGVATAFVVVGQGIHSCFSYGVAHMWSAEYIVDYFMHFDSFAQACRLVIFGKQLDLPN